MKIETTRFGLLDIDENKIITMPHGMLGFPESHRFVLFRHKTDSPFFWYQSVDEPSLAFVMINPSLLVTGYRPDVTETFNVMGWKRENSTHELYVVVNIPKDGPEKMTANLIGPVVFNPDAREAVQMVITDSPYSHRFPLLSPSEDEPAISTGSSPF